MRKAQPCPTLEEAQICLESQGGFLEEMVESRGRGGFLEEVVESQEGFLEEVVESQGGLPGEGDGVRRAS